MEQNDNMPEGFEEYLEKQIVPLIEDNNRLKDTYRSKFWVFFFTIIFIISADILGVLFYAQIYHEPIHFEQLFLFVIVALSFMYWPIFRYKHKSKHNIFAKFLNYYGIWKYKENKHVDLVHSPIIPAHSSVNSPYCVEAQYEGVQVEIRDTIYQKNKNKVVSNGVVVYMRFPQNFVSTTLLFDKNGFYRKNKFNNLQNIGNMINIPSSNYFNIFSDDPEVAQKILGSIFFERILDMKDIFKAKNLYVEIHNNLIRLYFENSQLYFDTEKLWSKKIDKNKFKQINDEFEQTALFIELINGLWTD